MVIDRHFLPSQSFPACRSLIAGCVAGLLALLSPEPTFAGSAGAWVSSFWPTAKSAGISRKVFDAALGDFTPDPDVLIESYARLGLDSIFLRPINYQGFARKRHAHSREQGAVWRDYDDPTRASARNTADEFGAWLAQMKPYVTAKTWHGGRGWPYAKMLAHNGRKMEALRLYLTALVHGCYRPRLSAIVFLQIFLNANSYRAIADTVIGWLRKAPGNANPKPI